MKRTTAFIISVLLCFAFSVISFADDIYIVDDGEEPFVPDVQETTTAPATTETTTSSGGSSIIGDTGALEGYFNDLKDKLGNGVDSLFNGLEDFDFNLGTENTTASSGGQTPPSIDGGERPTQSTQSQQMIQDAAGNTTKPSEEKTTVIQQVQGDEVHTIVIVENANDESALSGSTLTLIVFIAAIVIIILAGAIVLVIMTKRTEYNSSVMDKSTIPTVEKPRAMTDLLNDNIADDGNDYGNIAYWND